MTPAAERVVQRMVECQCVSVNAGRLYTCIRRRRGAVVSNGENCSCCFVTGWATNSRGSSVPAYGGAAVGTDVSPETDNIQYEVQ